MITSADRSDNNERAIGPILSGPLLGEVSTHAACIWVRARNISPLTLNVYPSSGSPIRIVKTPAESEQYCLVFQVNGLTPGLTYEYDFSSQYGSTPRYPLKLGLPSSARRARIAFGSCNLNWAQSNLPIFDSIGREQADVFVMNGDTSYFRPCKFYHPDQDCSPDNPNDWDNEARMMQVHLRHRDNAALRRLVSSVPTLGIWDDHDYGPDDSDSNFDGTNEKFTKKEISLSTFKRMWVQRKYGLPEAGVPGIFSSVRCGPVEIFLTDGRYHRQERNCILGTEQLTWLKATLLSSTAPVKLVVSGSVVLPEFVKTIAKGEWEGWRRDAYGELAELLAHIEAHDITGVVFASGDLHLGYLMHRSGTALPNNRVGPEYWEISASPLTTEVWTEHHVIIPTNPPPGDPPFQPTYDPWLVKEVFDFNYGLIDIDLDRTGKEIVLHLKDVNGHDHADAVRSVPLNDLRIRPRTDKLMALVWPTNNKAYFFKGGQYVRYERNPASEGVDPGYPQPIADNWPGLWAQNIDAAIEWNNGKTYFFKGDQYVCYDMATDQVDPGYPKRIADGWPGLWTKDIDAAVMWNNGKAYFFKGAYYIRYDVAADKADHDEPLLIAEHWPGLWPAGIDAAVMWNNGKAYFFKGMYYVRYDVAADKVDHDEPLLIAKHWAGLWPMGIDAAVRWNNGKAYFFNGARYMRYDVAADKVDAGYPMPILRNWPELAWKLPAGLDTAVVWPNGKAYFFSGNGYLAYAINPEGVVEGYPKYTSLNWGKWPAHWFGGIDAGLVWDAHTAYFFKGKEYVRYDIDLDQVDPPYPRLIKDHWPGLAKAFPDGVDSAVDWGNGFVYFFKGTQYVKYRKEPNNEGVEPGYPYEIHDHWPGLDQLI